jgi:hypothetical protein
LLDWQRKIARREVKLRCHDRSFLKTLGTVPFCTLG